MSESEREMLAERRQQVELTWLWGNRIAIASAALLALIFWLARLPDLKLVAGYLAIGGLLSVFPVSAFWLMLRFNPYRQLIRCMRRESGEDRLIVFARPSMACAIDVSILEGSRDALSRIEGKLRSRPRTTAWLAKNRIIDADADATAKRRAALFDPGLGHWLHVHPLTARVIAYNGIAVSEPLRLDLQVLAPRGEERPYLAEREGSLRPEMRRDLSDDERAELRKLPRRGPTFGLPGVLHVALMFALIGGTTHDPIRQKFYLCLSIFAAFAFLTGHASYWSRRLSLRRDWRFGYVVVNGLKETLPFSGIPWIEEGEPSQVRRSL